MTNTSWLWDVASWLSLPTLVILATVMIWRREARKFAFFFLYILIACLVGIVRFFVYKEFSPRVYFYVFWCSDFVVIVATFLSLYEIFLRRLFPRSYAIRAYRYLFPIAASVIAFLAFLTAIESSNVRAAFFITSRVFDFFRSAVIGFFVFLILAMGRRFAGREFWLAAGFGIQAATALAVSALRTRAHYSSTMFDSLEPIAFDVSCLIWLFTFMRSEGQPIDPAARLNPDTLHQARAWESTLKEWLVSRKNKR